MALLQMIQCPACGAPLSSAVPGAHLSCAYCGSRLEVRQGASGLPLAVLGGIGDDTAFLARIRLREELQKQLQGLDEEIANTRRELQLRAGSPFRQASVTALVATALVLAFWHASLRQMLGEPAVSPGLLPAALPAALLFWIALYAFFRKRRNDRLAPLVQQLSLLRDRHTALTERQQQVQDRLDSLGERL